jgi:outer membrane protein assembly factor BamB
MKKQLTGDRLMLSRLTAAVIVVLGVTSAVAEEWPAWRGPRGDGISSETALPSHWSATDNVVWKVPIPGKGHSSPIVWGERIFLTTCLENQEERVLLCLNRLDGHVLWQREVVKAKLEAKHDLNSYASATPVTDGRHVWVTFYDEPHMLVFCYDVDGMLVWRRSPGEFYSKHGFCSSPVLYKDLVIINGDQDAEAWIVALEKNTGVERWRTDRPNRTRSYCTPLIVEAGGRERLVMTGSKCVAGYDPSTGKQLWLLDGPTEQFVASMVFTDGVLFLTAGFPTYHIMGLRPDGHVLWHDTRGAGYVPSPIAHGKYFFVVNDNGIASCLEARTGKRMWQERLGKHHSASPVSVADYLFFPDDAGTTYVVRAAPKFEVVSRNRLGEECYASPAIAHGQLFIRTLHHLWCIGRPQTSATRPLTPIRGGATGN